MIEQQKTEWQNGPKSYFQNHSLIKCPVMKKLVDKMSVSKNAILSKSMVDKKDWLKMITCIMPSWQNAIWQNDWSTKWLVDKLT